MASDDDSEHLDRYRQAMPAPLDDADMGESTVSLGSISFGIEKEGPSDGSYGVITITGEERQERRAQVAKGVLGFVAGVLIIVPLTILMVGYAGNELAESYMGLAYSANETDIQVPEEYSDLSDIRALGIEDDPGIPLVWDIPGDGDVLQSVLSSCMGIVAAGGALGDPRQMNVTNEPLEIFEKNGKRYVNVYTGTLEGIERANNMSLLESGLADAIYAPMIFEVAPLFSETYAGQMIALFHHPVHRIYSIHHILRKLHKKYENRTISQFLHTLDGGYNNDWLTRELSGGAEGAIDEEHFQIAREVLRKKCLVGVTSNVKESLRRFFDFFGWQYDDEEYAACEDEVLNSTGLDRLYSDLVEENSTDWRAIVEHNPFDMRLWEFINMLYKDQEDIV